MLSHKGRAEYIIALRHLDKFIAQGNLDEREREIAFTVFVVDSLINRHARAAFERSAVVCDAPQDTGLDGIAVLVDGGVVTTPLELEQAVIDGDVPACAVVLIQATRQAAFQARKIELFAMGACDLFAETPQLRSNKEIARWREVVSALRREVAAGRLQRPELTAYYASAGRWQHQEPAKTKLNELEAKLRDVGLLASVAVEAIDLEEIGRLGREFAKRSENIVASGDLHRLSGTPPDIVTYTGTVPAADILRMITREEDGVAVVDEEYFSENARSHLGQGTQVNKAIAATIKGPNAVHFPVYNLGLTIICRAIKAEEGKLRLFDSQIVNGCQTASILFEDREIAVEKRINVFVRILEANNPDLVRDIVIANNSQNLVHEADLIGLLPFNRNLAHYFDAMYVARDCNAPYYACRRGQHYTEDDEREDAAIDPGKGKRKYKRIGVNELILAYLAMVCGEPQQASFEYKKLRKSAPKRVFSGDHGMEPYFSAGFALMRLREAQLETRIPSELAAYKAYFLHLFGRRLLRSNGAPHWGDQAQSRKLAMEANAILDQPTEIMAIFAGDVNVIEKAIAETAMFGDRHDLRARSAEFFAAVERLAEANAAAGASGGAKA